MEQFDLYSTTDMLLTEFDRISYDGNIAILEWFYKTKGNKLIFEVEENAKRLYNRLSSRGYEEVLTYDEELKCFKKLMEKTEDDSEQRVGYYLISLIMKTLKENKPLSRSLEQFICIYNETYNKKKTFETMMDKLSDRVGQNVLFVIVEYGTPKLKSGYLEKVVPFQSVTINGETYAFIGYQRGISNITDSTGTVLYNNGRASFYENLNDFSVIEKKCQDLFGNNYNRVPKPM